MPTPRSRGDTGTGLIGSSFGVLAFLGFLLFATQLLVSLYANSTATTIAYDGASHVATARIDHRDPEALQGARARAEDRMRRLLGELADETVFDWSASTADTVALTITSRPPGFMLRGIGERLGTDTIVRTVRVRIEAVR